MYQGRTHITDSTNEKIISGKSGKRFINMINNSINRLANGYGENGSPCDPLVSIIKEEDTPAVTVENFNQVYICNIHGNFKDTANNGVIYSDTISFLFR